LGRPGNGAGGKLRSVRLVLTLVLIGNAASCGLWMHRNGFLVRPLPAEFATARAQAVRILVAAERGVLDAARTIIEHRHQHGPVLSATAALVALSTGDRAVGPVATWICSCVVFGTLLLFGTWRLATGLGLPPWPSVAATALVASSPVVACYQRTFFHQMPMAALVTLALAETVRTHGFTRFGPSMRAALLCGLACLAKNVAPIYLAGPILAEVAFGRRTGQRIRWGVLAAALSVAVFVVAPW